MRSGCTSCAQAASVLPSWEREGKQDWEGLSLRWLQLEESPELTSQACQPGVWWEETCRELQLRTWPAGFGTRPGEKEAWGEVSPSWRKSRATLQLLTGSESLMGVWITCLSPAPREIVLCKRKQTWSLGVHPNKG